MEKTLLGEARRHLETAETVRDRETQLFHIREAHQLVIAAEEEVVHGQRMVQ